MAHIQRYFIGTVLIVFICTLFIIHNLKIIDNDVRKNAIKIDEVQKTEIIISTDSLFTGIRANSYKLDSLLKKNTQK